VWEIRRKQERRKAGKELLPQDFLSSSSAFLPFSFYLSLITSEPANRNAPVP
jgi:hypothetical protein